MPLLVHAVAWWIIGLWVGQADWYRLPLLVIALVAAVMSWWPRVVTALGTVTIGAVALLPAGMITARAAVVERQACREEIVRTLNAGGTIEAVVEPTAKGRATLIDATGSCRIAATMRWSGTPPPEGVRIRLAANARRTERGLALQEARVQALIGPDPLRSVRAWAGRTIDAHFRARAGLVRALLVADQDGIPHELRDRYADAGLVHMLSVSGMHVAIIASALLALGSLLRLPRRRSELAAIVAVTLYVLVLGCPAPAVRSAVMLIVMALASRWQRPLHDWTALALGAVVPTIDPLVVNDLGWQLSVSGMAALVAARSLRRSWRQWAERRRYATLTPAGRLWQWMALQQGATRWLVNEISTGLVATLITAPLIAWTFGRLSLIAPLSNLLAGPIIGVLQPALFLVLLLAPIPALARATADATQPAMALLDRVADGAAAVPGAVVPLAPTLLVAVLTGVATASVVRGSAATRRTPWMILALISLSLAVWMPVVPWGGGALEVHVIDVGQGDGVAIRTPRGRWVLVDAGPRWKGGDAGRRAVVPHLRRRGGDVALFVLSHAHEDHAGGAASVIRALPPQAFWEPAFVTGGSGYRAALEASAARGVRWERVRPGRTVQLDGVSLTVLAPDSAWTAEQVDANETSVVLRVAYGRHRVLLTGDAEREEEAWLVARYTPEELRADVLKLGHHGSRTSSSAPFLDAVRPRLGIASVGTGNRYGHPAPETLQALLERGVPVLRTDLEGTIIIRSDGRVLDVEARGERWRVPDR